jgi:cytochrome c peroxidase
VVSGDDGRLGGIKNLVGPQFSIFNSAGPFNDSVIATDNGVRRIDHASDFIAVTPPASADGRFRVKGLRNVSLTAPYMHAGQLATLDDVVHFYNGGGDDSGFNGTRDRQLHALGLSETQISDLVSFLESLTGTADCTVQWLMCDPVGGNDATIDVCNVDPCGGVGP